MSRQRPSRTTSRPRTRSLKTITEPLQDGCQITLPVECIVAISLELLRQDERSTVARLLRLSKSVHDAVAPTLYRRLELTDRTLISLFRGLNHRSGSSILGFGGSSESAPASVGARKRYLLSLVEEIVLQPMNDTYEASFAFLSRRCEDDRYYEVYLDFAKQSANRSWLISQISGTASSSGLFPRLRSWDAGWLFSVRISTSKDNAGSRDMTVTFGERDISLGALRAILGIWGSAKHINLKLVFRPHQHFRLAPPIRTPVISRRKDCGETCASAGLTLAAHISELVGIIAQYRVPVEVDFHPHPVDHQLGPLMHGARWEAHQGNVRSLLVHLGFSRTGPRKEDQKGIRQTVTVIPPREIVTFVSSKWLIEPPPEPQKSHPTPLVLYRQIAVKEGNI